MIEQRAVAVLRLRETIEEVRELRDVIGVQLREPVHVAAIIRVVRQVVERIADARLREHRRAQLAREHQRGHAGNVRLQRNHLQIHQQLEVFLKCRRHACRHVGQREIPSRRRVRALDPPLDLTHVVQVLCQPPPIRRRQILL
jgi:hypothetical protein